MSARKTAHAWLSAMWKRVARRDVVGVVLGVLVLIALWMIIDHRYEMRARWGEGRSIELVPARVERLSTEDRKP